jgi:ABC-type Fe3+/spermidine/putrescine transport system ATPase subunit
MTAMTAVSAARIVVDGLVKDYGETRAVGPVSFTVEAGEFVSLLGPSGCGKTTTLRLIAGFEEPTAGEIDLGERRVTRWAPERREVGFVFQSYALFPHLSVFENVGFGLRVRRVRSRELRERVAAALEMVNLPHLGERMPRELSAGQQQRVALARSLVLAPPVLLLDEPFSNLDLRLRQEMRAEVARLQRRVGFTAVFVTHDQGEALSMSDRVIVMDRGRIEQAGPPAEVYERPRTRFSARFLGGANVLEGTVTSEGGRRIFHADDGGRWVAAAAGGPAGGRASVAIRREKIGIGPEGEGRGANLVPCVVEEIVYTGDRMEFVVRTEPGATLRVESPATPTLAALGRGAKAALTVEPDDIRFLAER